MAKVIVWTQTQGDYAGDEAVTVPANQNDVAKVCPEVADMTEAEFLQWIINRDVLKHNPENVHIEER